MTHPRARRIQPNTETGAPHTPGAPETHALQIAPPPLSVSPPTGTPEQLGHTPGLNVEGQGGAASSTPKRWRPKKGSVWRHYLGAEVRVISIAEVDGLPIELVVYRNTDTGHERCILLSEWHSVIDGQPRYVAVGGFLAPGFRA